MKTACLAALFLLALTYCASADGPATIHDDQRVKSVWLGDPATWTWELNTETGPAPDVILCDVRLRWPAQTLLSVVLPGDARRIEYVPQVAGHHSLHCRACLAGQCSAWAHSFEPSAGVGPGLDNSFLVFAWNR